MEGGTLYGLSNALFGEITAKDGAVVQNNFPDWRVMRMEEAPRAFEVEIVDSNAAPAGVGEPATPPAAPALTNAIFAATCPHRHAGGYSGLRCRLYIFLHCQMGRVAEENDRKTASVDIHPGQFLDFGDMARPYRDVPGLFMAD